MVAEFVGRHVHGIVWVQFPFSNLSEHKVRPALVISNDAYNNAKQDVLLCAITSSLQEDAIVWQLTTAISRMAFYH